MHLQNVHMLRQLAREHEAELRQRPTEIIGGQSLRLRRWLGLQVVRLGAWIGSEPSLRSAPRLGT